MGAFNSANLKKTVYYLRRNGIKNTCYAIAERLSQQKSAPYSYEAPSEETLADQREAAMMSMAQEQEKVCFSIVVPTYRTSPAYLRAMIESVQAQSYPFWELILADATEDDSVAEVVAEYTAKPVGQDAMDCKIGLQGESDKEVTLGLLRYIRLSGNAGISANTNEALQYATGVYIGLLDHDDVLAPDALFEIAEIIRKARQDGVAPKLIYTDEDKCNGEGTQFYEPNRKEKFNYDLILSNNYICHFMVMDRELLQKLGLRSEYDGAQDYDLILRALTELGIPDDPLREQLVCHVPKVLYHWRCHTASTAENPRSKEYAYDAGRKVLEDHLLRQNGRKGHVLNLRHVGFYRVVYDEEIFACRPDLGAVGFPVISHGKIIGGRMSEDGQVFYEGLSVHYSGELHRAVLTQDAEAVDIRCISLRRELWPLFESVTGVPYQCKKGEDIFDASTLSENMKDRDHKTICGSDHKEISLKLCRAIREQGYRILWCRRENE